MSAQQRSNVVLGLRRKSLEGVRIFACRRCGAPGVFKGDEHCLQNWPGCYDKSRVDQPVGETCPNCGTVRLPNENLGELTASMPRWVWKMVLVFKWCLIWARNIKRRLKGEMA